VASIHPQAQSWMMANGKTVPSIVGLTHRVEEPLKAGLDDPSGIFGTTTLDATGAYSVADIDTGTVNLGIGGGIRDACRRGRVVPRQTVLLVVVEAPLQAVDQLVARDDPHVADERLRVAQPAGARVGEHGDDHFLAQIVPLVLEIVGAELGQTAGHQTVHLEECEPVALLEALENRHPVLGRTGHVGERSHASSRASIDPLRAARARDRRPRLARRARLAYLRRAMGDGSPTLSIIVVSYQSAATSATPAAAGASSHGRLSFSWWSRRRFRRSRSLLRVTMRT
jgi:hypothetical protein